MLAGFAGHGHRRDRDAAHLRSRGADLNGGNTRNHIRRTHRYIQRVRPGVDLFKHVLVAYMRVSVIRKQYEQQDPNDMLNQAAQAQRCTPRIQRPNKSPTHAEMAA